MRLDLSCKIISLTLNDRFAVTDVSSCKLLKCCYLSSRLSNTAAPLVACLPTHTTLMDDGMESIGK